MSLGTRVLLRKVQPELFVKGYSLCKIQIKSFTTVRAQALPPNIFTNSSPIQSQTRPIRLKVSLKEITTMSQGKPPLPASGRWDTVSKSLKAQITQPIGPAVSLSQPAPLPSPVTLSGSAVTLTPLLPEHADALYDIVKGEENKHLFTYLADPPYASLEDFRAAVLTKSESKDPLFFAIIDNNSSTPIGWATLMRIDSKNRVVEVGNILFSPRLQRTKAATEAMYLLAKYVFEDLQYRRCEWKCDNLNGPSKRAAIRFGFTFEGLFRKHMVYKSRSRDTCWFSMTDEDWSERGIKKGFEAWLEDDNFDLEGKQKMRLEEVRGAMEGQKGPLVAEV